MASSSQRIRTLWLAILLSAAVALSGCGRKETAPLSEGGENSPAVPGAKPAEAPLELQTEQKLEPLTRDDVELYLKVMRAAAERVKSPRPDDQAIIAGAGKILAGSASGRVPTQDDVKTLARAHLVAVEMDQIVAEDMKLDAKTYRGIAEAVESAVPNPSLGAASGKGMPGQNESPTPLQQRLSSVNAANERFLIPYRNEIEKLLPVVRNPLNLPK